MSLQDKRPAPIRQRLLAPVYLRALVRRHEVWLVTLAVLVGALAGFCVWMMTMATRFAHKILFNITGPGRLSGADHIIWWRVLIIPAMGGVILGLFNLNLHRGRRAQPVDPIEANALHGGRMSLRDSCVVGFQTFVSNGCGASVGLEAGFTQLAAAFGARIGAIFRVRREDQRILVGCGAGAAIGAAFHAPMAGSFYAFELILGNYSLANLAPIVVATISAIGVTHILGYETHLLVFPASEVFAWQDVPPIIVLALISALLGIAIMKGVAQAEQVFTRYVFQAWMRPAIAGVIVGCLALVTPTVLSGGHAAMRLVYDGHFTFVVAASFLLFKILASCISIGAGFRGGLFFASLYIGALTGAVFNGILQKASIAVLAPQFAIIVGMAAMATAIIGSPMAMICLALEMTGNFQLAVGVLLANMISMLTVRRLFGYSFATWRFHLRGETIHSALDVSWMRRLNVGGLMRAADAVMAPNTLIGEARARLPLGAACSIVVADESQNYVGIVQSNDLHNLAHPADAPITILAMLGDDFLIPSMNIREAVHVFSIAEADTLAVLASDVDRKCLGILSEKYALKRYAKELDRNRQEWAGEARINRNLPPIL